MHFLILRTKHKLPAKTSLITPLKKGKKKNFSVLKISPLTSLPLHRKTLKFLAKNIHEKSIEKPQKKPIEKTRKKILDESPKISL